MLLRPKERISSQAWLVSDIHPQISIEKRRICQSRCFLVLNSGLCCSFLLVMVVSIRWREKPVKQALLYAFIGRRWDILANQFSKLDSISKVTGKVVDWSFNLWSWMHSLPPKPSLGRPSVHISAMSVYLSISFSGNSTYSFPSRMSNSVCKMNGLLLLAASLLLTDGLPTSHTQITTLSTVTSCHPRVKSCSGTPPRALLFPLTIRQTSSLNACWYL
jgi:hypothetical protein